MTTFSTRRPFPSMTRAPAFRILLVRVSPDRHVVVWTCHHILLDGWSAANVWHEIVRGLAGLSSESPPEGGCQYRHYFDWLQQQDEEAAQRYWRQQLSSLPASEDFLLPLAAHPQWRDVHTTTQHIQIASTTYENMGRLRLTGVLEGPF